MTKAIKRTDTNLPAEYGAFLKEVTDKIRYAQLKAALSINKELFCLYWDIGKSIVNRQEKEKWGSSVIEQLSKDIRKTFPGTRGFSARNIWNMRAVYLAYTKEIEECRDIQPSLEQTTIVGLLAEIPWGQTILLTQKVKDPKARLWYLQKILDHGWSRAILLHQVDSQLYERQGAAVKITNFAATLPKPQSDLAHEVMKSEYNFDFSLLAEKTGCSVNLKLVLNMWVLYRV